VKKFFLIAVAVVTTMAINAQNPVVVEISDVANYIDFRALSFSDPEMLNSEVTSTNPYVLANGTKLVGYQKSDGSEVANSWNDLRSFPHYALQTPTWEGVDSLVVGTMFRAGSGTTIELGAFTTSEDGSLIVFYQPNGDSERGVSITLHGEEVSGINLTGSGAKINAERPAYAGTITLPAGSYNAGEVVIKLVSNTSNILGVGISNLQATPSGGGDTPLFPDDPGTLVYSLELHAAVVDGDTIAGQAPTGAGGYPAGTEVTITAKDITGYEFVSWSDDVTDKTRTIVLNESMTLMALYSHSMIEIAVAANRWTFICLPPLGNRQYTEDMFTYDGLTGVKWGTYNGSKRAAGQSGWETPETFNALQGYIIYSTTAGTLRINAYQDEIRQGESENISVPLTTYESYHTENASWNFLGNPYAQGFSIAGLADAGIESPITVWNGTGYTTYTPGIDDYTLQPFEAFFIQKAEGAPDTIQFIH
jgi:hypothetical protein